MDDVHRRAPLPLRLYRFAVEHGGRWPLGRVRSANAAGRPRVGYYVWRFPALTDTYIQREVGALRQAGLDVEVFADDRDGDELLDAEARGFVADTHYLLPLDGARLRSFRRRALQRDRLGALNALAYTALHRYGVHKRPREDLRIFRHALALAGQVLECGITHLHSPWANLSAFIALLAARMAGVPFSVQARASTDLYRTQSRSALGEIFAHATFIVTSSEFNRAFIERTLPERLSVPIEVVYEGLDPARFVPRPTRATPGGPLRILSVGRLIEEKGFEFLLRALALMREGGCAFRCVIVGGPEGSDGYAGSLMELCHRLGLDDTVFFTGALPFDRVLQEYSRADLFTLPSVVARSGGRDVTPNVLVEAMAMQLPVVATKMTAIGEIVDDRVSGILVPPRNPAALAQALLALAGDAALAKTLGANGRRRVEERFDVRKNARRYLALFAGARSPSPAGYEPAPGSPPRRASR